MQINYHFGLNISLWISLVPFLLLLILWVAGVIKDKGNFNLIFFFTVYSLGIGSSIFLIFFPIINLFGQPWFSVNFYAQEVASGVLGLRVASILLSFRTLMSFIRYFVPEDNLISFLKPSVSEYPEIKELEPYQRVEDIVSVQTYQSAFYVCILITLWLFLIVGISSIWSRFASWLIFFIIDDWAIIADYYSQLKGRVIRSHIIRLAASNLALFLLCIIGYFTHFPWWSSILFIASGGAILFIEAVFFSQNKRM
jgi:hypothetical protein